MLEYYSGILFLRTNRVGDFDEAFTSRIHMSLYYPELSEEKTRRVFKINMDLIRERFALKKRQIIIEEMDIGAFATQHYINHPSARWNGRQSGMPAKLHWHWPNTRHREGDTMPL